MTRETLATFARCRQLAGQAIAQAQVMNPKQAAETVAPPRLSPGSTPRRSARPLRGPDGLTDHERRLVATMPPALWTRLRETLARIDRGPSPPA